MAEASDKPLIYVSYSHYDKEWLSYILSHLAPVATAFNWEIWADTELPGGDKWLPTTESKLRACRVFVLLISPQSIASDFAFAVEFPIIRQREKAGEPVLILPIVVSPTATISFESISDKKLRPRNGEALSMLPLPQRDQEMAEIVSDIVAFIEKSPPQPASESPKPEPVRESAQAAGNRRQPIVLAAIIEHNKLLAADRMEFRRNQVVSWPASELSTTAASRPLTPGDIVLGLVVPADFDAAAIWERYDPLLHSGIVGMVGATYRETAQSIPVMVTEAISGTELGSLINTDLYHSLRDKLPHGAVALQNRELNEINAWLTSNKRRAIPYPPQEVERLLRKAQIPDPKPSPASAPAPRPNGQKVDAYVPFRNDAPGETDDALDRGPLALFLGRRLHLIWCEMNGYAPRPKSQAALSGKSINEPRQENFEGDTFIVHIDAPWGGGKTTFANFVSRVLDPRESRLSPNHFLRFIASPLATPADLEAIELDEIFYADPGAAATERDRWPAEARLPWIIARYDAWRDQYVYPPWWHVFLTIEKAICSDLRNTRGRKVAPFLSRNWWGEVVSPRWSAFGIHLEKFVYQMWNAKIRNQLTLLGLGAVIFLLVWQTGVITYILQKSGAIDLKRGKEWIDVLIPMLGFAGVSIATLFTVIGQSLVPDLDFTAEHKQIGVSDPIGRFRNSFRRILRRAGRPVLLIVDDIDRCEPKAVVEILRGFQTIVRSPRLFVIVLGDRSWIEKAHEIYHKDFAGIMVGTETGLGARFVEKMFQLSFTLPAMKAEVRNRFTRTVLGGSPDARAQTEAPGNAAALGALHEQLKTAMDSEATVPQREEIVGQLKLAAIGEGVSKEDVDSLANLQLVAAAGSDADYQGDMFNILSQLAATLPNNPRQIKRIVNAFAIYETVGRLYFNYQLTADGTEEGTRRAYRWRQLAMWVTLATEWPALWRTLARRPDLIDVALAKPPRKNKLQKKLLAEQSGDEERAILTAVLHRLTYDYALARLLCVSPNSNDMDAGSLQVAAFPETRLEAAAIYDFNRIMWEPGFPTQNPAGSPAPATPI